MKKGPALLSVLVVFICTILLGSAARASVPQGVIHITGEQWPPYNNYVNDSKLPGFMLEIVRTVLSANGYDLQYEERPWARAILETRDGNFDAIIGAGKSDAPDFIFPIEEVGFSTNAFYVKSGSGWKYSGIPSLKSIKLGVYSMTYGDDLDNYIKNNPTNVDILSGSGYLPRNLAKLDTNRIDATIDDDMVIQFLLKKTNQTTKFKKAGVLDAGYSIYLGISPKYTKAAELSHLIESGIKKLRTSGQLKTILSKYGVKDWK